MRELAISCHNKNRGSQNAINELEINSDTVRSAEQQFTKTQIPTNSIQSRIH